MNDRQATPGDSEHHCMNAGLGVGYAASFGACHDLRTGSCAWPAGFPVPQDGTDAMMFLAITASAT